MKVHKGTWSGGLILEHRRYPNTSISWQHSLSMYDCWLCESLCAPLFRVFNLWLESIPDRIVGEPCAYRAINPRRLQNFRASRKLAAARGIAKSYARVVSQFPYEIFIPQDQDIVRGSCRILTYARSAHCPVSSVARPPGRYRCVALNEASTLPPPSDHER